MLRSGSVLLLALALAAPQARAQEPPAGFAGEIRVNNITVDVQVWDENGVPVSDLRREDFRVLENDVEQRLTNFLSITGGEVQAAADSSLVGATAARQVVLFFDLYLLTEPDKRVLVKGLQEHFAAGLPPAMTIAVVSFDGTLRVHAQPTASRERVLEALKEVDRIAATGLQRQIKLSSYENRLRPGRESYSRYEQRRYENEEYWMEMRRMVGRVDTAFSAALQRFSGSPARKVALLVSPGFPRAENVPQYRYYDFFLDNPDYRNLALFADSTMLAANLEYTLYTLDASGYQDETTMRNAAERGASGDFADVARAGFWREADRKDTLIRAARDTGGEAIFSRDGGAAIADVERLTSSYYSLGYQPDHYGDGETYTIKVEVIGKPGCKVAHRTSYVDRPFETREAERSRAALLTGYAENPLGVVLALEKPTSKLRMGAAGMRVYRVPAELRIPYANLVMIPQGDVAVGQVQVVLLTVDANGNQSDPAVQRLPIQLPAAQYDEARRNGYYSFRFTLEMEGGQHSIRISVDDVLGRTSSAAIADLKL
jgi:VWFA-related protein